MRPPLPIALFASASFLVLISTAFSSPAPVELHWLDGKAPAAFAGTSWGTPWPRGAVPAGTSFALHASNGTSLPLQSWPLATWPDGSTKWSAHAVPANLASAEAYSLIPGEAPSLPAKPLTVTETPDSIAIDTGVVSVRLPRKGAKLVDAIVRDGVVIAEAGRLVCLVQSRAEPGPDGLLARQDFQSELSRVTVEQSGPVRAVVKLEGKHRSLNGDRSWLPFTVRLYFHAGSEAIRIMHTIVFDGDEKKDFIRGLGLRFSVPLRGELHDRHIRFSGEGEGLFAEAVRGITGLRRDPGPKVTSAQLAGTATPDLSTWPTTVSRRMELIPAYGDWTLFQPNSDSFQIRKRTTSDCSWLTAGEGHRSSGLAYLGTPKGGLAVGLRNFWQSTPTQIDVRGATGEKAELTLWLWAPDAAPMDLRFYHDGMGQDTYAKQLEGLEITYEDYEPGFATPEGVARTSELTLWALASTPSRSRLLELADANRAPAMLTCAPAHILSAGVFGRLFSLPDRSTPVKARIENSLDALFAYYQKQTDERRWYGFWNYGDVMHSYDTQRHVWKYDVGGMAWDNSELSTDIWLWLSYLRTGRADIFRYAEAMTRHTGEVDVHHLGRFAPLGSRHNVMHWGCSAKQLRISTVQNRRYYYYLTGDERVGDLMREQIEGAKALVDIQPGRKLPTRRNASESPVVAQQGATASANIGFGTDWGALAAAWLTEWERTGDPKIHERLLNSMRTIAAQPHGFFSSGADMELASGTFQITKNDRAGASHLSAAFGEPEVCVELIELIDLPEFKKAWLQYCRLYNATAAEQTQELGRPLGSLNLGQGHSRLTAYAAASLGDKTLAARAWKEFLGGGAGFRRDMPYAPVRISGPAVLEPVDEIPSVSTNSSAQYGLAAIQCLALAGKEAPVD